MKLKCYLNIGKFLWLLSNSEISSIDKVFVNPYDNPLVSNSFCTMTIY